VQADKQSNIPVGCCALETECSADPLR